MELNTANMCTALREADIQSPDWVQIACHFGLQLQISASDFLQGWYAYADGFQPSWIKLAKVLEGTGIAEYKDAAEQIRRNQGIGVLKPSIHLCHPYLVCILFGMPSLFFFCYFFC